MIYITQLRAAYAALRDYLVEMKLYDDEPTPGFDRQKLARLFTEYYDAEAAVKAAVAAVKAEKAALGASNTSTDAIAKDLGYEDYAAMRAEAAKGQTIIEDGHLRTILIDADNITTKHLNAVSADGSQRVQIEPGEGIKLYDATAMTARFTGKEAVSIKSIIPTTTAIPISEVHIAVSTATPLSKTVPMAKGTVKGTTSLPILVSSPTLYLYSGIRGFVDVQTADINVDIPVAVQVEIAITIMRSNAPDIVRYDRLLVRKNTSSGGTGKDYYVQNRVGLLTTVSQSDLAQTISNGATNNVNIQFKTEVRFSKSYPGCTLTFRSMFCDTYACFGSTLPATLTSQYLDIGGKTLNSTFYGNGVLFSKSIDQYVGMLSTSSGTEMIARCGDRGFRFDGKGMSLLKDDGETWDSSGVLCAYRVEADGGLAKRFGVKDKPMNRCSPNSKGRYQLYHNLGHSNYMVQATAYSPSTFFVMAYEQSDDYVRFEIRTKVGDMANIPFYVTIYGAY